MTVFIPTVVDVKALDDVVNDITELSDSLSVDEAVAFRVALVAHLAQVKFAIDALDMQLVKTLEMPRTVGGWIHQVRRKKETERFDHSAIAGAVVDELKDRVLTADCTDPEDYVEGGRQAIQIMSDIYLSPSLKAKTGVLDALGIERRKDKPGSVRTWTPGDEFVDVTPVLSEVQE